MLDHSLRYVLGIVAAIACTSPAMAQQASDPLTRFLDSIFKQPPAPAAPVQQREVAPHETAPATQPPRAAQPRPRASAKGDAKREAAAPAPPQRLTPPEPEPRSVSRSGPETRPRPVESEAAKAKAPEPEEAESKPPAQAADAPPAKAAEPPKQASAEPAPAVEAPTPAAAPAPPPAPAAPPVPSSPAAALERVNSYFNSIDQLSAYFLQKNPNGQQAEGTLSIRRPGQLHFAYAPPSTLEIVSDGRNVAIRDKRLRTNDVYPIGQTPLKFLLQENVDLARDTKLRDVQVGGDGMVIVRFDDSATLGGTSKITLRFDARANALKQWTIVDAQGYETSVILSGLNVVHRTDARAAN